MAGSPSQRTRARCCAGRALVRPCHRLAELLMWHNMLRLRGARAPGTLGRPPSFGTSAVLVAGGLQPENEGGASMLEGVRLGAMPWSCYDVAALRRDCSCIWWTPAPGDLWCGRTVVPIFHVGALTAPWLGARSCNLLV